MSALMLVYTTAALSKALRDKEEAERICNKLEDARTERLLADGAVDLLVWANAFGQSAPPPRPRGQKLVLLAPPSMAAHAREPGDLARRHGADHRVAMLAAGLQVGQHRHEVVFQEEHAGDDDVGRGDVGLAAGQGLGLVAPFGCGMHRQAQAGQAACEREVGPLGSAGEMAVHGHDDHVHRRHQRATC